MRSSILLRVILFIGLIGLTLYQLRLAIIAQTAYSDMSSNKAVQDHQTNPRLLVHYGKEELLQRNYKEARTWLQRALKSNPVYVPAWLTLAELENDTGNTTRSIEILEYLDGLMKDILRWRWEKAMLAYLLGREDIVKSDLSWLLQQEKLSWETRKKILNFSFSLWPEPQELVKIMGAENSMQLFFHAIREKNIDTASYLWAIVDLSQLEQQQILQYINLLIKNQHIDTAAQIWKKYYPSESLLYNGNFSLPLVKGGFGWRIWQSKNFEAEVQNQSTPKTSLHIHFSGEENISFYHVRQLVSLPPGQSFTLSGELRCKELTTDQRPFIEVVGKDCSLRETTEMVEPDQDWTPFSLNFSIPEECNQGVEIGLRRSRSNKIDSLIGGDLWMTNFSIQHTSPNNVPE